MIREDHTEAPYQMYDESINEGELSKIRSHFTDREHLSQRAVELGLNKYILYGKTEQESEAALEDMMEALIGAVVIDKVGVGDVMTADSRRHSFGRLLVEGIPHQGFHLFLLV